MKSRKYAKPIAGFWAVTPCILVGVSDLLEERWCTRLYTASHPEDNNRYIHCRENLKSKEYGKGKKGKVIPLHAMEALWVRGGIAPTHS
jgi:hypothetical protein